MLNPMAYENSRPDGFGVLEIMPDGDGPQRFVPLKRTQLSGELFGPVAAMRLSQAYGYSRDVCDKVLEAVYRFPLPGDAAVTGVLVRFGDVEILASLKEREQAETDYEEARREGKQAALLTRESPDVFSLQVAGIRPDQEVLVIVSYAQLARAEGEGWSLRVPLTTSPRYVRSDEVSARHAQGQPLSLLRDPGHRFSLDLRLHAAEGIASPTHALSLDEGEEDARVSLREGEVLPDRDFVLTWRPGRAADRPALHALVHEEADRRYFLALVSPPVRPDPDKAVPREVVLLVDHSGSMEGAKWEAADWTVKGFLSGLTGQDTFALGLFHNTTRWLSRSLHTAEPAAVDGAIRFLEKHRDSGGTELGVALEQALDIGRSHGARSRHVMIVTDAEVTDAGRILRLASEEALEKERRRISVLCIDAAPNSFLAHELAERGGGVARFLTSSPDEEDVTTALDEVLADWAAPVLSGLRLDVSAPEAQAAGREGVSGAPHGWSGIDLGDLPEGRALWVVGCVPAGEGDLAFRLAGAGGEEVAMRHAEAAGRAGVGPAVKALFGARRVLGLEFLVAAGWQGDELREQLQRLGYDPSEVITPRKRRLFAENVREDAQKALRALLVREALEYGLASSETAFVAVRTEAGKPVEGRVVVANALPSGWSDHFLGMAGAPATMMASRAVLPAVFHKARISSPPDILYQMADGESDLADDASPALVGSSLAGSVAEESTPVAALAGTPLFSGVPSFPGSEAILFDTARSEDAGKVPDSALLTGLQVRFADPGAARSLDRGLVLLVFVGDLATPRAKVRLADLMRQQGRRPLNIRRDAGDPIRLVLADPGGAWASGAPALDVTLCW